MADLDHGGRAIAAGVPTTGPAAEAGSSRAPGAGASLSRARENTTGEVEFVEPSARQEENSVPS